MTGSSWNGTHEDLAHTTPAPISLHDGAQHTAVVLCPRPGPGYKYGLPGCAAWLVPGPVQVWGERR